MDAYFHDGEIAVQEQQGTRQAATQLAGANIHDTIPFNQRLFPAAQKIAWVGGRDLQGQPWLTVMVDPLGVMAETDGAMMRLRAGVLPAWVAQGDALGMLFIEPLTRKRLRINGMVAAADQGSGAVIAVAQCYGNCPRYIHQRKVRDWPASLQRDVTTDFSRLGREHQSLLAAADTFYIASCTPPDSDPRYRMHGVDVSHRAGEPGVLRVVNESTLQWPDFPGNKLFNTLGNIRVWPKVAIVVPDFEKGGLLEIRGDASEIDTDLSGAENRRGLQLAISGVYWTANAIPSDWERL